MNSTKAQTEYKAMIEAGGATAAAQDDSKACNAFYGIDEKNPVKTVQQLGEPIPGYSGVNRRVQADNVFGMTYAEARRMATESLKKIDQEKSETLKETSKWIPENQRK